jgi:hypothetical protein
MIRKRATVVDGSYVEVEVDEGPGRVGEDHGKIGYAGSSGQHSHRPRGVHGVVAARRIELVEEPAEKQFKPPGVFRQLAPFVEQADGP